MKHPSIWLAALLLGAAPWCAMAANYDVNAPLLVADAGAQELPLPATTDAARNDTARSDVADAEAESTGDTATAGESDAASGLQRATPATDSTKPTAAHDGASTAGRKGRPGAGAHPAAGNATGTSWQSLLPGSIQ